MLYQKVRKCLLLTQELIKNHFEGVLTGFIWDNLSMKVNDHNREL